MWRWRGTGRLASLKAPDDPWRNLTPFKPWGAYGHCAEDWHRHVDLEEGRKSLLSLKPLKIHLLKQSNFWAVPGRGRAERSTEQNLVFSLGCQFYEAVPLTFPWKAGYTSNSTRNHKLEVGRNTHTTSHPWVVAYHIGAWNGKCI